MIKQKYETRKRGFGADNTNSTSNQNDPTANKLQEGSKKIQEYQVKIYQNLTKSMTSSNIQEN